MCAAPGERDRAFDGLQEDRSVKRLARYESRQPRGSFWAPTRQAGDHHHRHVAPIAHGALICRPLISGI
jgi:hypothetical protein